MLPQVLLLLLPNLVAPLTWGSFSQRHCPCSAAGRLQRIREHQKKAPQGSERSAVFGILQG